MLLAVASLATFASANAVLERIQGANQCVVHPSIFLNNTDYSDGNGPRTAANASDCCNQCINQPNCAYWAFNIDEVCYLFRTLFRPLANLWSHRKI